MTDLAVASVIPHPQGRQPVERSGSGEGKRIVKITTVLVLATVAGILALAGCEAATPKDPKTPAETEDPQEDPRPKPPPETKLNLLSCEEGERYDFENKKAGILAVVRITDTSAANFNYASIHTSVTGWSGGAQRYFKRYAKCDGKRLEIGVGDPNVSAVITATEGNPELEYLGIDWTYVP